MLAERSSIQKTRDVNSN